MIAACTTYAWPVWLCVWSAIVVATAGSTLWGVGVSDFAVQRGYQGTARVVTLFGTFGVMGLFMLAAINVMQRLSSFAQRASTALLFAALLAATGLAVFVALTRRVPRQPARLLWRQDVQ